MKKMRNLTNEKSWGWRGQGWFLYSPWAYWCSGSLWNFSLFSLSWLPSEPQDDPLPTWISSLCTWESGGLTCSWGHLGRVLGWLFLHGSDLAQPCPHLCSEILMKYIFHSCLTVQVHSCSLSPLDSLDNHHTEGVCANPLNPGDGFHWPPWSPSLWLEARRIYLISIPSSWIFVSSQLPKHSRKSYLIFIWSFSDGASKECACKCRNPRRSQFYPWVRKIPWSRKCQPLQYSCLENSMDRGAWWATVHGGHKELDMTERLDACYPYSWITLLNNRN